MLVQSKHTGHTDIRKTEWPLASSRCSCTNLSCCRVQNKLHYFSLPRSLSFLFLAIITIYLQAEIDLRSSCIIISLVCLSLLHRTVSYGAFTAHFLTTRSASPCQLPREPCCVLHSFAVVSSSYKNHQKVMLQKGHLIRESAFQDSCWPWIVMWPWVCGIKSETISLKDEEASPTLHYLKFAWSQTYRNPLYFKICIIRSI